MAHRLAAHARPEPPGRPGSSAPWRPPRTGPACPTGRARPGCRRGRRCTALSYCRQSRSPPAFPEDVPMFSSSEDDQPEVAGARALHRGLVLEVLVVAGVVRLVAHVGMHDSSRDRAWASAIALERVAVVPVRRRGERKVRRDERDEQHPGLVAVLRAPPRAARSARARRSRGRTRCIPIRPARRARRASCHRRAPACRRRAAGRTGRRCARTRSSARSLRRSRGRRRSSGSAACRPRPRGGPCSRRRWCQLGIAAVVGVGVVPVADLVDVLADGERGARRHADRAGRVGVGEAQAARRERGRGSACASALLPEQPIQRGSCSSDMMISRFAGFTRNTFRWFFGQLRFPGRASAESPPSHRSVRSGVSVSSLAERMRRGVELEQDVSSGTAMVRHRNRGDKLQRSRLPHRGRPHVRIHLHAVRVRQRDDVAAAGEAAGDADVRLRNIQSPGGPGDCLKPKSVYSFSPPAIGVASARRTSA